MMLLGMELTELRNLLNNISSIDEIAVDGLKQYVSEVKSRVFPDDDHSFTMKEETLQSLYGGKIRV